MLKGSITNLILVSHFPQFLSSYKTPYIWFDLILGVILQLPHFFFWLEIINILASVIGYFYVGYGLLDSHATLDFYC